MERLLKCNWLYLLFERGFVGYCLVVVKGVDQLRGGVSFGLCCYSSSFMFCFGMVVLWPSV